eukprot:TRINITY_DN74284_c0_g1_i1.p1 TRINITY_DN74284_c0_g1~~TRINITY_DN74284_c0_g1_i1.p1  ORF type:complete len:400 (+),score=58.85 TRINITY_DN74284_c0_g1_i1:108-1202(+)
MPFWEMGTEPRPLPAPAPSGSVEVCFPRNTTFPGNMLQVFSALLFTSYVFFFPIGSLVWFSLSPWVTNACSWRTLWGTWTLYVLQLFVHRPHLSKGWHHKWFLYGYLCDWILCYHDAVIVREGPPPDPKRKYMFAHYPHGVYGVCRAFSGGVRNWRALFPGIFARWGSFGAAFYWPGVREFSLCAGCVDASKPVLEKVAKRGESINLLPGGIDEMNLTDGTSKQTQLVMTDRKGFVKLAIENGMDIIPGFCFGEKWIHETVRLPDLICRALRPFRLSGTLLRGRGPSFLGFLKPLAYVYGEPIQVKQQRPVDEAYLDEVHAKVMQSVQSIFDRYKARFGYAEDETLVMVSVAEAKALGKKSKAS